MGGSSLEYLLKSVRHCVYERSGKISGGGGGGIRWLGEGEGGGGTRRCI